MRLVLAFFLLFAGTVPLGAQELKPVLEVTFKKTEAIPGQPLSLRLTVLVPTFLPKPPVWPALDAPNLLVRLPEGSTGPTSRRIGGTTWSGVTRHYRISPMVPGDYAIPPQEVVVTYADPETNQPVEMTLTTAALAFSGVVPEAARGLDPLIAAEALDLTQEVTGDPQAMAPGDSVTRTVRARVRGTSPMFLPDLLPAIAVDGVAAYPDEPVLEETTERGEISGTRTERVTLIAEGGSAGEAPPVTLDWYNLDSGRVETAAVDGFPIHVDGPPATASEPRDWRGMALLTLAAVVALAAAFWLVRRVAPPFRRWAQGRRDAWLASERFAYAALRRVVARREHARLPAGLDAWAARLEGADPRRHPRLRDALLEVGAAQYGRGAPRDATAAWRALAAALPEARRAARKHHADAAALPPLNPTAGPCADRRGAAAGGLLGVLAIAMLPALDAVGAEPAPAAAYVGSAACRGCHADAAEAWAGSHHALAWTWPGPETVVADFDGTEFAHDGTLNRFRIDPDGSYYVTATEKDGVTTDYRVHSVAGIEPLQQYLLEAAPGRLQSFDVVWDTERRRWFHLYPDQDLPPGDGLHWTGPYKTWNARCAECHATGYEKRYDHAARSYASAQSEIGVGCEACHGPGAAHVAWAQSAKRERTEAPPATYGFSAGFATTEATIQQCAGCHSRREAYGDGNPLPGTPYHDAYNLALLRPGLYHADGQILDEVYVYGSFLQSKMYAKGVGCLDCHDAHSAELVATGNAVCTQCHSPAGDPRFPSLARKDYDTPSHHFHEPGSAGAACTSCHMIERVYMGVDGRRDHSFRVPRPDLAAETGGPDACTDCHADKGADWAAARIADWYPESDRRGLHYGQTLARGRADPAAAGDDLARLAADQAQAGIVRATALWLMQQANQPDLANRAAPLLEDPDPLVRAAAVGLQRGAPANDRVARLVALLDDPSRTVRMAAAREMLNAPVARFPEAVAADLQQAMREWRAAAANRLDFPETHLQLGGMALTMRNPPAAEAAFREVVRLDPQRTEAWVMLARIAAVTRGGEAARAVVVEGLGKNPEDPALRRLATELEGAAGSAR